MYFKSLTVELTRNKNRLIVARVKQQSAECFVFGRNLLTRREITRQTTAERAVEEILQKYCKEIRFDLNL